MKKCFNCNTEIPDFATVCPFCNTVSEKSTSDRNYDNYYDDVPVADACKPGKPKPNSSTVLKVGLVVFGLAVAIAVCVSVLCLI